MRIEGRGKLTAALVAFVFPHLPIPGMIGWAAISGHRRDAA
jgi:hypothetical protein